MLSGQRRGIIIGRKYVSSVTSSSQGGGPGRHRERAACFCRRVCTFVQGGRGVRRGEEQSGAVVRRESVAECEERRQDKRK